MSTKNYRKITVGDSFSNCIAYVKGIHYLKRSVIITDIILDEKEEFFDIYVKPVDKDKAKIFWKSISVKTLLESENDLNLD